MELQEMTREQLIDELSRIRDTSESKLSNFAQLIDSAPDAFALFDPEFRLITLNRAGLKMLGATTRKEEIVGKQIGEIYEPAKDPERIAKYTDVLKTGEPFTIDEINPGLGKESFFVSVKAFKVGPNLGLIVSDITARRQIEEKLRDNELRFHSFLDNSLYGYFEIDLKGNIKYANRTILNLLKLNLDEIRAKNIRHFIGGMDVSKAQENLDKISSNTKIGPSTYTIKDKHGNPIHLEANTLPLFLDDKLVGFHGTIIDITERIKAEEALKKSKEKFSSFLFNSTYGYFEIDLEGHITFANRSILKSLKYSLEEIQQLHFRNLIVPEDVQRASDNLKKLLSGDEIGPREYRLTAKDGSTIYVEVNTAPLFRDEDPKGFQGTVIDITEKKKFEIALKASEEKYRFLVEKSTDIPYAIDQNGSMTYISPQLKRYGIEPEKALGNGFWKFIHQDDKKKVSEDMKLSLSSGTEFPTEFRLRDKNGHIFWIEERGRVNKSESGEIIGISGILRDITERKQAEEALRKSEEKWRSVILNSPNIEMIIERDGTIQFINKTVKGYTVEDTIGKKVFDYIDKKYHELMKKIIEEVFDTGENRIFENQAAGPGGELVWYENFVGPVVISNKVVAISMSAVNINERKEAEIALRESEAQYRLLAENVTDVIWVMDLNFNRSYISPSIERLRGYTVKEALKHTIEDTLTPQSRNHMLKAFKEELKRVNAEPPSKIISRKLELEVLCKDGSTKWTEIEATFLRDKNGNPSGLLGVTRDISDRIETENALRESEAKYRHLVDNASFMIARIDREGKFSLVNKKFLQETDLSNKDVIGSGPEFLLRFYSQEDFEKMVGVVQKTLTTGEITETELNPTNYRGENKWIVQRAYPWFDFNGELGGAEVVSYDITDRKQAEIALRESESRYRVLIENLPLKIFTKDMKGNYISCNANFSTDIGTTQDELYGKTDYDFFPKKLADKYRLDDKKVMDSGITREIEEMYTKDGQVTWVQTIKTPIRDDNGEVMGILGIFWDITERKAFARRVAEAHEEERKNLSEQIHDDLGQLLTVAKIRIDKLRDARLNSMAVLTRELSEVSSLLTEILQKTRALSHTLRPPLLDQLGLLPAIRALADRFKSSTGLDIKVETINLSYKFSTEIEMLAFRVVQEGLTNAARHSNSPKILVNLSFDKQSIFILIRDYGKGFDVEDARINQDCLGLRSMESRVLDSGGTFHIESAPSQGTILRVTLPVSQLS